MFAENHKISGRQAFRLLTFDLLGISTLLVPTMLAKTAGRDGIFGIVLGVLITLLYVRLLAPIIREMKGEFPGYLEEKTGVFASRVLLGGYALYFILLAGYTAYLFVDAVRQSLLGEESFGLVLGVLLLLSAYGVWGGIEGRARTYEVLFWFLLIPLFLMCFFALDEVQTDYWTPVFMSSTGAVFSAGYSLFLCLAFTALLLFLGGYVEKKERLLRAGRMAVLLTGGIHLMLYLILLGIFGAAALAHMDFPAITMMSTVKISGGFLKRTDAFMFGIWFFTLYALFNSCTFYGGYSLTHMLGIGRKSGAKTAERNVSLLLLPVLGLLALLFYQNKTALHWYEQFLWYVGTPFLVFVPVLLRFFVKKSSGGNARKAAVLALVLISGTVFAGCGTAELEERNFPAELAVRDTDNASAKWLAAEYESNELQDYSHLKVLLLETDLLEDEEQIGQLLEMLEQKNEVPRNTYVVAVKSVDEVLKTEKSLGQTVGEYLEQQFEVVSEIDKLVYPTIGQLYQEQWNTQETLLLPYVTVEEGKPVVEAYYVWRRGAAAGLLEKEAAMLSFFTGNHLDSYLLAVGDSTVVELKNAKNRIRVSVGETTDITVEVYCEGTVVSGSGNLSKNVLETEIAAYMNDTAQTVLEEKQIDLTNSYRKLGGEDREGYAYYRKLADAYETDAKISYQLSVIWVD